MGQQEINKMPEGIDPSQEVSIPQQPGTGTSDGIAKQVHLISPDLSSKDIGKYMTAWKSSTNKFYPNRQQMYDLYEYVLGHDNYLNGLIQKRHTKVLNKKLVYKAGDKKVDAMDAFLQSDKLRQTIEHWLWDKQWGLGGLEFIVGKTYDFVPIPRKHIKPKWGVISIEQSGMDGYKYADYKTIMVVDNGGLGILQTCAMAVCFKKDAIADWAELIEGYGQPTIVLWYSAFNPQIQRELDLLQKQAGSARRVKLPEGTRFEYKEAGGNYTGDLQMQFIDLMNKEMAVRQLGGSETTGTSKGSGHAQSAIHYEVEKEIMKADMDYICDLLNSERFIEILKMYNLPVVEGGKFEFDREVDIDFIKEFSSIIKTAKEIGLPISKKQVYDTLSLDEPKGEDDVLKLETAEHEDEETDDEPTPEKPAKKTDKKQDKKTDKKQYKKPPKASLYDAGESRWDKLKNFLSDFFA